MTAQKLHTFGPYAFFRGGEIPSVTLAYETWGTLDEARGNAILLTTGLSPGSHARSSDLDPSPGWWERMIGPGRALDTDRFFVVCNNSLGSCHGSTGPSSIDERTGEPYRLDFPVLSVEDIARTSRELIRSLGIERLHAVIGSSLGGMTALAYAVLFPDEVERLASISAASAANAYAIALRSLQREAVRADPDWNEGRYTKESFPRRGMAIARKMGVSTYRSSREWDERFGRTRQVQEVLPTAEVGVEFAVESYLAAHAEKFVKVYDPNSYLYLSRAMDLFDLAEHGTSLEDAARKIRARRCLVIGVESDILFPMEQQEALAKVLESTGHDTRFHQLPSTNGHDSFLIDIERFGPVVGEFLLEPG